jgi:hypothetical protein
MTCYKFFFDKYVNELAMQEGYLINKLLHKAVLKQKKDRTIFDKYLMDLHGLNPL